MKCDNYYGIDRNEKKMTIIVERGSTIFNVFFPFIYEYFKNTY